MAATPRYFLASLQNLGDCGLLGVHQSKTSSLSSRAGSFLYLQVNKNYKLQILSLLINNLLTSASSSSSSSRLSSDSSKSSSLLLGLEGRSYAAEWLNLLRVLVYYFFSRASTDFWSADYMAIILLKSVATSVNPICPGLFERI